MLAGFLRDCPRNGIAPPSSHLPNQVRKYKTAYQFGKRYAERPKEARRHREEVRHREKMSFEGHSADGGGAGIMRSHGNKSSSLDSWYFSFLCLFTRNYILCKLIFPSFMPIKVLLKERCFLALSVLIYFEQNTFQLNRLHCLKAVHCIPINLSSCSVKLRKPASGGFRWQ